MDQATDTGTGYLQVQVTSAGGSVPEEGALVLIYDYPDEGSGELSSLIRTLKTDISGQTEKIPLPTPPKSASQTPGEKKPYSSYNIEVVKDGFFTVEGVGVPVFDGVTSLQKVNLIPQGANAPYPAEGTQIIEAPSYNSLRGQPEERRPF